MKRMNIGIVEAAVEKHFDPKKYTWHKYTSSRGTKLEGARGRTVTLREGDLYGVKEFNSKDDMYLVLKAPDITFKVPIKTSDKIMEERSKEYKGKTPTLPKNPPAKVKIDLADAKKKSVKEAAKATKPKVAGKPTLTEKKIDQVKKAIKAIKQLKQNASNLRKLDKLKEELKKLRTKQKKEGALPKDVKQPAVTMPPVNPHKETKKLAKAKKVKVQLHNPIVDEDDEEIPTGHVRYGGQLIEPDELEFDDDLSGIDLPIPESWSSSLGVSSMPMYCVTQNPEPNFDTVSCLTAVNKLEAARNMCNEQNGFIFQLMLCPQKVFDLRKPECREDYNQICQQQPQLNLPAWNDPDFTWPHTGVPKGEFVSQMRDALAACGYDAMLAVESKDFDSIAIFNPSAIAGKVKLGL